MTMKMLKFTDQLAQLIVRGEKDSTWRLYDDKDLSLEDELSLVNKDSGEVFARAVIVSILEKPLGEVVDADFEGHEQYESLEAMYAAYRGYYGDKVTPESMLKIVRFRLTNLEDIAHDDR